GQVEHLLPKQREDGALLPDHAADQGVDADEQGELAKVGANAQAHPGRVAHGSRTSACPVARAQSSGPPTATVSSVWPARSSRLAAVMARSPCPHMSVSGPDG